MQKKLSNKSKHRDDHHVYGLAKIGFANGTFGELLQGILPNNEHFLVTMPISCYSKCIIIPDSSVEDLEVYPPHKTKSLRLAKLILLHFNVRITGRMIIRSELEEGKGLASSSADLVATARALEQLLDTVIHPVLLRQFLKVIEPTDGVMYPGCVAFYHVKVELLEAIGVLPNISIVAIDEGGQVDTIEYNKICRTYLPEDKDEYQRLLTKISYAIKCGDMKAIGEVATRSAVMNQANNSKKHLQDLIRICDKISGLGVIVAHSGTYIGIILDNTEADFDFKQGLAIEMLREISTSIKVYEAINHNITGNRAVAFRNDSQHIHGLI